MDAIVKLRQPSYDREEKTNELTEVMVTVFILESKHTATATQYFISFDLHDSSKAGKKCLILPILQTT